MSVQPVGRRLLVAGLGVGTAVGLALVAAPPGGAAPTPPAAPPAAAPAATHAATPFDARTDVDGATQAVLAQRRAELMASPAVQALATALGPQSLVDMDAATGTPRQIARLDGFLTGASSASAVTVARTYLAAHADLFHLTPAEITALAVGRDYVDVVGTHHVSFVQVAGGTRLFGNGVKADVTKAGQLVQVTGSPVPGLAAAAVPAKAAAGSADAAIRVAKTDTAEADVAPAQGDTADRVLFHTASGTRAAWQTLTMSARTPTLDVVDAATGRIVYRDPLADDYEAPTSPAAPVAGAPTQYANIVDNYPGAPAGGTLRPVDLNAPGWLPQGSVVLFGNNAHTYPDLNDNNRADQAEEIDASGGQGYRFPLRTFTAAGAPCSAAYPCTWDPNTAQSWRANLDRTATQNFYYVNNWHDHLAAAPIGFTEAAGNFQQVNRGAQGKGGDPVLDQPLDGANGPGGLPDGAHIDNANFATPPDGTAPVMQMYLFHQPGVDAPDDPFVAANGSDEADIVYHEYTHGLSHRLVVDAGNVPALDSQQGASMGEAWSDWYGLDYLADQGFITDTARIGDVREGRYVFAGRTIRSEPTDCPVGTTATACPGTPAAGPGGYTYGDFGKIAGGPEVHADGEIWTQTLWDVRAALGSQVSESIVTRGMEFSPTFPSMLDMRNAILLADQTVYGGAHRQQLWRLFAARGMGYFAGTVTGNDVAPVEDFSTPPPAGTTPPSGYLRGVVRDSQTGAGVSGVRVAVGGHDSGTPASSASAVTAADGSYRINGLRPGTYPDVYALGAGYDLQVAGRVRITSGGTTLNWRLVRNWAAASGGGAIASFTGPDYTGFGCGPGGDIDGSYGTGWGSTSDLSPTGEVTAATPKQIVIRLPRAVDLSGLAIDPSNTCGDDPTSATGDYRVEVSTNGTRFTTAAEGTFTPADLGGLAPVTLAGTVTGVVAVRFTMLTPQAVTTGVDCPSAASGCDFLDSTEVEVYGVAAAA